ncbi:hypothetical protein BGX38DRAFT_609018 [Terfezia claveryi]|nr:hypothetical protein BGX38DRAFT_609018 [Terfezia claveryi]
MPATKQIVVNLEQESRRAKARERKYKKGFAKRVAQNLDARPNNEDPPLPKHQDLEKWVLAQQLNHMAFSINEPDEPIIRKYIWDLGLRGSKQTDLFESLLNHLLITPCLENAGKIEKVKNRVHNDARIANQVNKMIQADCGEVVAQRLLNWLHIVRSKENGTDALVKSGIFIWKEEGGSVDEGIMMIKRIQERIRSTPGGADALVNAGL